MAFDPELYLTETAVADFAPITDALIVAALIRQDEARPVVERDMAKFVDEALAGFLRVAAAPGEVEIVNDAMRCSQIRLREEGL